MTEGGAEISVRLRLIRDRATGRRWLFVPLEIGPVVTLAMVPNTVAGHSLITPAALNLLRSEGLAGAEIVDFRTGRQDVVLQHARIAGHLLPDFAVHIRDVAALHTEGAATVVDGYLGLDVLLRLFSTITLDTRALILTVRLH